MAAPKDFLTGFNHNVRHKGRGYHVQTEDSGEEIAHVITHLFEGGNILASKKTSYSELRGKADLKTRVRSLMEEQHRQMLRELVNGGFDGAPAAADPAVAEPRDESGEAVAPAERTGFLPPIQKREGAQTEARWIDALARAAAADAGKEAPAPADAPWADGARTAQGPGDAPWAQRAPASGRQDSAWGADPRTRPGSERPGTYRGPTTHERTVVGPSRQVERTPGPFPGNTSPAAGPPVLWPTATEAARLAEPNVAIRGAAPTLRADVTTPSQSVVSGPDVAVTTRPVVPNPGVSRPAVSSSAGPNASHPSRPDATSPGPRAATEPTPGPWGPGARIETVFGADPAAEKSLDEVILRYLAGERE